MNGLKGSSKNPFVVGPSAIFLLVEVCSLQLLLASSAGQANLASTARPSPLRAFSPPRAF